MAATFLSRFVSEVAPPQVVSVMRRRVSKILETIAEDERMEVSELVASSKGASSFASSYRRKEAEGSFPVFGQKWIGSTKQ